MLPSMGRALLALVFLGALARVSSGQVIESVGSRALGMGGAFVAVANDSSAGWWNPAGVAAGPFLDIGLGRALGEAVDVASAWRRRTSGFALATPPFGFHVYRLQITQLQPIATTESGLDGREEGLIGASVHGFEGHQVGVTIPWTVMTGVHVGTTLKYLRGALRTTEATGLPSELLDGGEALSGGGTTGVFDFDIGALAVAGPVRLGLVMRNVRHSGFTAASGGAMTLDRHLRVGAAFDASEAGGPPLTVALDADAGTYGEGQAERRVVALGAEQWLLDRRVGLRVGGRFNTAGPKGRTATAGASVSLRSGFFVDGHIARGSSAEESGWGAAARVSF